MDDLTSPLVSDTESGSLDGEEDEDEDHEWCSEVHVAAAARARSRAQAPPAASTRTQQQHGVRLHGSHPQHSHHHQSHTSRHQPAGHHHSERRQRMEAGINRNSRIWQVPDEADSHLHSLGPAPFDEDSTAAHAGLPILQFMPAGAQSSDVSMIMGMAMGPPGTQPILLNPSSHARSSSNAHSGPRGPLFVPGQGDAHRNGPPGLRGFPMPLLVGPRGLSLGSGSRPATAAGAARSADSRAHQSRAAAGAALGAASATRQLSPDRVGFGRSFGVAGSGSSSQGAADTQAARPVELLVPGGLQLRVPGGLQQLQQLQQLPLSGLFSALTQQPMAASATGSSAAGGAGAMPDATATAQALMQAVMNSMGGPGSQASSETGSPTGPFFSRSGPRLRARRTRTSAHSSAAAAAAARAASRNASSQITPGLFTFSAAPAPAAASRAPVPAAAAGGAAPAAAAPAASAPAVVAAPQAAPAGNEAPALADSSSSNTPAEASRPAAPAAAAAGDVAPQRQGSRWWPPWRILAAGWRLVTWILPLPRHNRSTTDTPAAATTPPDLFADWLQTGPDGAAAAATFALGQGGPGPHGRQQHSSPSRVRHHHHDRTRGRQRGNDDSTDDESAGGDYVLLRDREEREAARARDRQEREAERERIQQVFGTVRFPEPVQEGASAAGGDAQGQGSAATAGSSSSTAAAAGSSSGSSHQAQRQQQPASDDGPVLDRASPSGKRMRGEQGAVDSSRASSSSTGASPPAAATATTTSSTAAAAAMGALSAGVNPDTRQHLAAALHSQLRPSAVIGSSSGGTTGSHVAAAAGDVAAAAAASGQVYLQQAAEALQRSRALEQQYQQQMEHLLPLVNGAAPRPPAAATSAAAAAAGGVARTAAESAVGTAAGRDPSSNAFYNMSASYYGRAGSAVQAQPRQRNQQQRQHGGVFETASDSDSLPSLTGHSEDEEVFEGSDSSRLPDLLDAATGSGVLTVAPAEQSGAGHDDDGSSSSSLPELLEAAGPGFRAGAAAEQRVPDEEDASSSSSTLPELLDTPPAASADAGGHPTGMGVSSSSSTITPALAANVGGAFGSASALPRVFSLPELLSDDVSTTSNDDLEGGDDHDDGSSSLPGLRSDSDESLGLEGDSEGEDGGSSSGNDGPPSLVAHSTDDEDDFSDNDGSSSSRREAPWQRAAAAAVGLPELVTGSEGETSESGEDSDSGSDGAAAASLPGLVPGFLNANGTQRRRPAAAALGVGRRGGNAGQHRSGLQPGFLEGRTLQQVGRQQQPQQPASFCNMAESYYNRSGRPQQPQQQQPQQQQPQQPASFYNMAESYYNRSGRPQQPAAAAAAVPTPSAAAIAAVRDSPATQAVFAAAMAAGERFLTAHPEAFYANARARMAAAPSVPSDPDEDSGSEGSWETASEQDLEAVEAAAAAAAAPAGTLEAIAAAHRARMEEQLRLYEGSSEGEDADLDDDDSCGSDGSENSDGSGEDWFLNGEQEEQHNEDECDCPFCITIRNMSPTLRTAAGMPPGRHRNAAAAAAGGGGGAGAFSRPRSNAFVAPGSSTASAAAAADAAAMAAFRAGVRSGRSSARLDAAAAAAGGGAAGGSSLGLDGLCGDTGSPPTSRMPFLPPRGRVQRVSASGAPAEGRVPQGCVALAEAQSRVAELAGVLRDEGFTQKLLEGLSGVDPGHGSISAALGVLRGRGYTPVNAAVRVELVGGVSKVLAQWEAQRMQAQKEARQLLRRWQH